MTAVSNGRLSSALQQGTVAVAFRASDMADAMRLLMLPQFGSGELSASLGEAAVEAILAREQSGSTAMGRVALPHGRVAGLPRIVAALAVNPGQMIDGSEVRVMLAFVTPAQSPADHLRFLSAAAQVLREEESVEAMLQAPTAEAVLEVIRRCER